jgi:N-acyl-phosphatidylethanolamine-hydrolysing phospholipase D
MTSERRIGRMLGVLVLILIASTGCAPRLSAQHQAGDPAKPHHTTDGFRNLYIEEPKKNFFDFLGMRYFGDVDWADHESRADEVPVKTLSLPDVTRSVDGLRISWLGHSTFLIQKDGVNILTDPMFGDLASPVGFAGPRRYVRHVVDYKALPKIDYVVISHNHYDHLDETAIRTLGDGPLYLVPLKLKPWFVGLGIRQERVREFDWWDAARFPAISITAMPSQHWSARSLFDRRETLWASWFLEFGVGRLWFAGDTGYNAIQFKEIGEATGGVDVALIPIGGYAPPSFMKPYHVNPEEAIRIQKDVGAKLAIGMHWGTFPLTAEGPGEPPLELARQKRLQGVADEAFVTMTIGETKHLTGSLTPAGNR